MNNSRMYEKLVSLNNNNNDSLVANNVSSVGDKITALDSELVNLGVTLHADILATNAELSSHLTQLTDIESVLVDIGVTLKASIDDKKEIFVYYRDT